MSPLRVSKLASEMQILSDQVEGYVNRITGDIVLITEDDKYALKKDLSDLPLWQQEAVRQVKGALESPDYVAMPSSYDIDDWAIMESFSENVAHAATRERLLDSIHGRGAFRRFRSTVTHLNLLDQWYAFRDATYREFAIEWLKENDIPYEET